MVKWGRLILVTMLLALLLVISSEPTSAVEVPPPSSPTYIQTNGPTGAIGLGDWYTNNANGVAPGYHYFVITIPCGWPPAVPVHFDLFSPEMNSTTPLSDEVGAGGPFNTAFELYAPGTTIVGPNQPAPGAPGSITSSTYAPSAAAPQWTRFYTVPAPVPCGDYVLRAQATAADQNGWRLRVGLDSDADPNTVPPANYDNPDGISGTNDEITVGIIQTSYQHDASSGVDQCITLYEYVNPGLASVAFHNFDLDGNLRVRYYAPGDPSYDPLAASGGIVGTVSTNQIWNGGTTTSRGTGDAVANPASGWWRIVTCVGNHNQFIQEAQNNISAYYSQPPTPVMTVSKTDGRTTTSPGDLLTYTITFQNTSNTTATPGAATAVVLRDTIPTNTTYSGCAINAPYTGTCSQSGGVVTFTLNEAVIAGASGTVTTTVQVNAGATGTVTNTVALSYEDSLGNPFPDVSATDVDTILDGADLSLAKTGAPAIVLVGGNIIYTITVTNNGPGTAAAAVLTDTLPPNVTFVSATPSVGTCSEAGGVVTCSLGDIAFPGSATVTIVITTTQPGTLTNTASVTSTTPDPNPANNSASAQAAVVTTIPVPTPGPYVPPAGVAFGPSLSIFFDPSISKVGVLQKGGLGLPGEQLTWTMTIINVGAGPGTNIVITDTLQPELRVDGATIDFGTVTLSGQTVTFVVPLLNPGQSVQARIYSTVLQSPFAGQFENIASLQGTDPDGTVRTALARAVVPVITRLPSTGYPPASGGAQPAPRWPWVVGAVGLGVLCGVLGLIALRKRFVSGGAGRRRGV